MKAHQSEGTVIIPINNSDTAWLIVSDYNQDNNLLYDELREDILDPEIDQWHTALQHRAFDGVGTRGNGVGTLNEGRSMLVGAEDHLGGMGPVIPNIYNVFGHLVGGNAPNQQF